MAADAVSILPGGIMCLENQAKAVLAGPADGDAAGLELMVKGSVEYDRKARKAGEPWVHLLVQQNIADPPALEGLNSLRLKLSARLMESDLVKTADYTPALHAAQYLMFLSVQNLNRSSPGFGHYLWFGIPIYDDRQRIIPGHAARDTGGTDMFIVTPSSDHFTHASIHDRTWTGIDCDLLPLIRQGLQTAWDAGALTESRSQADYRIASINMGWEVPGLFDVRMRVRELSLRAT